MRAWLGIFVAVCLAVAAPAMAQTLATGVANNGSGGVFVDLQAVSGRVTITGFDVPIGGASGTTVSVEVWTRSGPYAGFTASNAGWTLSQTVTGITRGESNLTPFALPAPLEVSSAGVTAVYFHSTTVSAGLRYTGTSSLPPQTTWSNDDLVLFSNVARTGNVAFAGGQNTPRAFAGVLHYRNGLETAAPDNGSGGIFLNLQAVDAGLKVTGFDVPLAAAAGTEVTVEVWTRPGGYVGFTGSNVGWTLTQTVVAVAAGTTIAVPFTLSRPIEVQTGMAMGVYLHAVLPAASGSGIRYTGIGGTPPQTTWTDGDLLLFSDTSRIGFTPFAGGSNSPRVFSGIVRYNKAFQTAPSNNGNGGVFMTLDPLRSSLDLTGFDVPLQALAGVPVSVEVWTRPGSYLGTTGSNAGWTLTQTVSGVAPGANALAPFLLTTPIRLPTDQSTSIYIHAVGVGQGIRYTGDDVVPPQTVWSNSDLLLFSDTARTGAPFEGAVFSPRTFSGVLRYTDKLFANGFE